MEPVLSTIFPCCFPHRRSRSHASSGDPHERTPLIGDGSGLPHLSSHSNTEIGTSTPGSVFKRAGRKHNTILPSPAYDAHTLTTILDEFKRKLVSVDFTAGGVRDGSDGFLLSSGSDDQGGQKDGEEGVVESSGSVSKKHVTPVHVLRLSISTPSPCTDAEASQTRLVDIWSQPSESPIAPTTAANVGSTILSYSAAVKRGKTPGGKGKRFAGAPRLLSSTEAKGSGGGEASVEQKTYEGLAEIVRVKPLVHDWDLDDPAAV